MPLYHAPVDLAFVTDDDAKMLKNATFIIAYYYHPMSYIFRKPSSS